MTRRQVVEKIRLTVKQLDPDTENLLSDFIVDMKLKYDKVFSAFMAAEELQKAESLLAISTLIWKSAGRINVSGADCFFCSAFPASDAFS